MSGNSAVIIVSTFPSEEAVLKAGKSLISDRKCACVNFVKVRSLYTWKGRLEDQNEYLALFKTTTESASSLKERIKKLHPYEVPEIAELRLTGVSRPYLQWLYSSSVVRGKSSPRKKS